ncbi:hypothetical protein T440DRAFT_521415 [Plenodomus tracheiphilus IPT5]|uniref:Uncharacterized protein n=1 Tax=Plenodomus tracheiphilus IPT5 TaxID=1408161 RepID=A0A6A7AXK3_9PLEO|nr:hypothetical protein T440DRAFT_521415 [Plenodomus tracheiphilus IPT5]
MVGDAHGQELVNLLRASERHIKNQKRKIIFLSGWSQFKKPDQAILRPLFAQAKANEKLTIEVRLVTWSLDGRSPDGIRSFMKLGLVLLRAFRDEKLGPRSNYQPVEQVWRADQKLEDINLPNVKLYPGHVDLDEKFLRKVKKACSIRPFQAFTREFAALSCDGPDVMVAAIKEWHANGI